MARAPDPRIVLAKAIPVLGTSDLLGGYAGRGRRGIFLFPGVFFRVLPSAFSELTGWFWDVRMRKRRRR